MPSGSLTIEQVLTLLAEAPERLAALSAGLTPAQLRTAPESDEWSANEVLAHLRSCADVWGKGIARILDEDAPTIRAVSPRTWISKTDYPDLQFRPSLRSFTEQRAGLLALLEPLPPEGWARVARVTGAGKPLEWSVLSYAQRLARHEHVHVGQVEHIVTVVRTQ